MKSKLVKASVALGLLAASAAAYAASTDCCISIECCIQMLSCCL